MASQELRAFLSSVDSRYMGHADAIHNGQFTSKTELAAADRSDLVELGIPKGAAGAIIAAARGKGDSFIAIFCHAAWVSQLSYSRVFKRLHTASP